MQWFCCLLYSSEVILYWNTVLVKEVGDGDEDDNGDCDDDDDDDDDGYDDVKHSRCFGSQSSSPPGSI